MSIGVKYLVSTDQQKLEDYRTSFLTVDTACNKNSNGNNTFSEVESFEDGITFMLYVIPEVYHLVLQADLDALLTECPAEFNPSDI